MLCACGFLPTQSDRPYSAARRAADDSVLARVVNASGPVDTQTGFRLMPDGFYSLDARVQLIERARDSLDLQYYLIADDRSGRLVMRSLRNAALRGVHVRLLIDDLYTADALVRGLGAFPNVEVRLFNPFCCARGSAAAKLIASLGDVRRLNHRMHNKLFIADGVSAIMGGRNIADEYFERSATSNFVDMDVLVIGSVVPRLATLFDTYWNSPHAYPVDVIISDGATPEALRRSFDRQVDEGAQMLAVRLPPVDLLGHGPLGRDLDFGRLDLAWGTAIAFADPPGKVMATSADEARSMSVQMNIMDWFAKAKRELLISSPYFVPGRLGLQDFDELRKRDIKITILTNSLAANDVPLVHVGYARYRVALLRAGVDLYELSPSRSRDDERLMLPGMSLGRLHAKAAVMDQSTVYIGSMNLDPRSDTANTELGMLAECPELADQVIEVLDISKQRSAYHVRFAADGTSLQWLAGNGREQIVLDSEPEVTPAMTLRTLLLAPFVPEQLL